MQISFFEEFPNKSTLDKIKIIKFPTKLYLADYSIESYKQYKKELQSKYKNIKEIIWWPVLNIYEGYWLSPWSLRRGLLRIFHELQNENIPMLWDAELPKERRLIFTQYFKHFKNKRLIKHFFKKYNGQIYTAEYLAENKHLEYNCLTFNPNKYNNIKIKMLYSSMRPWLNEDSIKKKIKFLKEKYSGKVFIGLGVLATGINKNEKTITPENLERDLKICKEFGIKEVVIYRLGGLNKEYLKVINKFKKSENLSENSTKH